MNKASLIIALALALAGCAADPNAKPRYTLDVVRETAAGYPVLLPEAGIHFLPCKERNEAGFCTRWVRQSDMCVNPKGPYATPPLLKCPKDKNGNPMPFK